MSSKENLRSFLKASYDSFCAELYSTTSVGLQKEIANCFLAYLGYFSEGNFYLLQKGTLVKQSTDSLSEVFAFSDGWLDKLLSYTRSIKLNTFLSYNGIHINPETSWAKGGIGNIFNDLISGEISYLTFPILLECDPNIGIYCSFSVILTNNKKDGLMIKVNSCNVLRVDEVNDDLYYKVDNSPSKDVFCEENKEIVKKYTGYYASTDGTIEVQTVIDKFDLNWNRACVLKYIIRAGKKDPNKEIEDLEKAKRYIDYEIAKKKNMI